MYMHWAANEDNIINVLLYVYDCVLTKHRVSLLFSHPQGIDVDNQKQREEFVLLNDAMKLKNNPDYNSIVSAGGELLIAVEQGQDGLM